MSSFNPKDAHEWAVLIAATTMTVVATGGLVGTIWAGVNLLSPGRPETQKQPEQKTDVPMVEAPDLEIRPAENVIESTQNNELNKSKEQCQADVQNSTIAPIPSEYNDRIEYIQNFTPQSFEDLEAEVLAQRKPGFEEYRLNALIQDASLAEGEEWDAIALKLIEIKVCFNGLEDELIISDNESDITSSVDDTALEKRQDYEPPLAKPGLREEILVAQQSREILQRQQFEQSVRTVYDFMHGNWGAGYNPSAAPPLPLSQLVARNPWGKWTEYDYSGGVGCEATGTGLKYDRGAANPLTFGSIDNHEFIREVKSEKDGGSYKEVIPYIENPQMGHSKISITVPILTSEGELDYFDVKTNSQYGKLKTRTFEIEGSEVFTHRFYEDNIGRHIYTADGVEVDAFHAYAEIIANAALEIQRYQECQNQQSQSNKNNMQLYAEIGSPLAAAYFEQLEQRT